MSSVLRVSLTLQSMEASVEFGDLDSAVSNEISLALSSASEDVGYSSGGLKIPWHDFKRALTSIGGILKRQRVALELDSHSRRLVEEYLDDRRVVRSRGDREAYSLREAHQILHEQGFGRRLTNQQDRDLLRLLRLKHGANFSVPGAGKTTTLLALHSILKSAGFVASLFVVAPINAFISWEDELAEIFGLGTWKVARLHSEDLTRGFAPGDPVPDLLLINYEKLRKDVRQLTPLFIHRKMHLVLDEAHRIKSGSNNLSFRQIIRLGDLAQRRDILTGTPMPQSCRDLDPQFDFLWSLPRVSQSTTEEEPIESANRAIKGLFVRTTKRELGLADPKVIYHPVQMGPLQTQLYEFCRSEAARVLSGMDRSSSTYFRSLGRNAVKLLEVATNPMLLGADDEYYDDVEPIMPDSEAWELVSEFAKYEKAAKLEYLQLRIGRILQQDPRSKVVVWSYFIRNIKLMERLLAPFNPVSIYGGVPTGSDEDENSREGKIRRFHQDNTCRVLIGNPQACGEGISLHKICHYALYLDRTFNAAHYLQSVDRIHRLGLPPNTDTIVEILIAKGTIDEVIFGRVGEKTKVMGKVLDDEGLLKLAYDPADIPPEDDFGLDANDAAELQQHLLSR